MQPGDEPAPLTGNLAGVVIEVLVIALQEPVAQAILRQVDAEIQAKENPVGIAQEEAPRGIGLTAKLTQARGGVNVVIGAGVEHIGHERQVFAITAHVRADESRPRVASHQISKAGQNIEERRKRRAGEGPIGVLAQLLPPLVRRVNWVKKGHRIGHVYEYRHVQFAGCLPQRVKARIIHAHQVAALVADVQPERLPNLQTKRAALVLSAQPLDGKSGESFAQLRPLRPLHAAKDAELLGRGGQPAEVHIEDLFPPPAVQIHIAHHPGLLHRRQYLLQRAVNPAAAKRVAQVVVGIYDGEARLVHDRGWRDQLRAGAELLEKHGSVPCCSLWRKHLCLRQAGHSAGGRRRAKEPEPWGRR